MGLIGAGAITYDIDLIIFDKDGTLFDFSAMWKRIFLHQVDALASIPGSSPELIADLFDAMGVERGGRFMDPTGPLALATYEEIQVIMAGVLYRHGRPWNEALRLVDDATGRDRWPPLGELIQPVGDVVGLFQQLIGAGLCIGVVTTDDRAMTETMLEMAGLRPFVSAMACADDGLALKPAPDGILAVCRQLGVSPGRAMMVGDSPTDMAAAQAAGIEARVGVLTGVSQRHDLEPAATVVLASIQELSLCSD
jgi:phosphoglycolate phosphatase